MLQRLLQRVRPEIDPGLGNKVVSPRARLIRPDGNFNTRRKGISWWERATVYQWLGQISWTRFTLLAFGAYFVTNTLFALVYLALGSGSLDGVRPEGLVHDFEACWFFSAQTLTTVGYGHVSPATGTASAIAAFEALVGLLGFGVWTGLLFSRFSRARSRILFSEVSVVTPYRDGNAWMFRIVASHDHPLLEAQADAIFSWVPPGTQVRHYQEVVLERSSVRFFPMNWTLVHVIDEESPLYGITLDDMALADVEILVLVKAHDETYGQTVHSRFSWKAAEIRFGEKFVPMMESGEDGAVEVDVSKLGATEAVRGHL